MGSWPLLASLFGALIVLAHLFWVSHRLRRLRANSPPTPPRRRGDLFQLMPWLLLPLQLIVMPVGLREVEFPRDPSVQEGLVLFVLGFIWVLVVGVLCLYPSELLVQIAETRDRKEALLKAVLALVLGSALLLCAVLVLHSAYF